MSYQGQNQVFHCDTCSRSHECQEKGYKVCPNRKLKPREVLDWTAQGEMAVALAGDNGEQTTMTEDGRGTAKRLGVKQAIKILMVEKCVKCSVHSCDLCLYLETALDTADPYDCRLVKLLSDEEFEMRRIKAEGEQNV